MNEKPHNRQNERGNVLFYILIAVALLIALSLAVANSTRGNVQQLTAERARLYATEIIEFSNIMTNAVAQVRLRGTDLSAMCFDHTSWGANDYDHAGCTDDFNKIFHPSGAGLIWSEAPSEAMDATATPDNLWHIYGDNEIENIGSTCGGAGCSDLILVVDELHPVVCQQLNDLLGVTDASTSPPTDSTFGETRYVGSFGYSETIGDEVGGEPLDGKVSGCFQKTNAPAEYVFYKVLVAR
ncbi:MAG: hypothetical protein H6861_08845 [Rhodospirillales bacterium]|nr:hypothetical protein [Rhodospirillales bacterium]